jgi:hypothetical protein
MSTQNPDLANGPPKTPPTELEKAARAALDHQFKRCLTDEEWTQARRSLLEFVTILRDWGEQAQTYESHSGTVVSICTSTNLRAPD